MRLRNFLLLCFALFLTVSFLDAKSSTKVSKEEGPPVCTASDKEYNVGDMGPAGGIIFYDKGFVSGGSSDGKCWRYLEEAPSDQEGHLWSNLTNNALVLSTETYIGSGYMNTLKIITQNKHATSAAKICHDLIVKNGDATFNDYFLPSRSELTALCNRRPSCAGTDTKKGLSYGPILWSSSEFSATDAYVAPENLQGGGHMSKKYEYVFVCIRAF